MLPFFRIKSIRCFVVCLFVIPGSTFAQLIAESVSTGTSIIGLSAISVNSITAKTLTFEYPLYNYVLDSLSNYVFVSGKQKDEQVNQVMSRNFFAALNPKNDSIKWLNESSLYNLEISATNLLVSNDKRTMRFNKLLGFDEISYGSKIIYTVPRLQLGLKYDNNNNQNLQGVDLRSGLVKWTCSLTGVEDWVDIKEVGDTMLLIAANGLHAIHVKKGLLWSEAFSTSIVTNKALVHSLAKYNSISKTSHVIHTAEDENRVTQLASNILIDNKQVFIASRDKLVATDLSGKTLWTLDLKSYPISKMLLTKADSSLILVNFGLAMHSDKFINWGKPFVLRINLSNGSILNQYDLSKISNLADYTQTKKSLVFAGKDELLAATPGENELKTILALQENKYGRFVEFIDGDKYYIFKEGYCVPLNFINDNLVYFRTDNDKIYGVEGDYIEYEYHYNELYNLVCKFDGNTLLQGEEKTIITSSNFELLFSFDLVSNTIVGKDKLYFIGEKQIHIVDKKELK